MLLLFLQRECHRCPEPTEIVRVDTVYQYDSIPYIPPPMFPKPGNVINQPIPKGIDSLAVARAYFSKRMGIDTLVNDSLYLLSLSWEVQENKPTFFQPTIVDRKPTTIISHTITEKPRNKVFVGIGVGGSPNRGKLYSIRPDDASGIGVDGSPNSFGLAPSAALYTKRENLYTASYDVINKDFYVTFFYKIKLKKK